MRTHWLYWLCTPVDNWAGSLSFRAWSCSGDSPYDDFIHVTESEIRETAALLLRARTASMAFQCADGDGLDGVRVVALPSIEGNTELAPAFLWKQDNNGATFFLSPYRLSYLDDDCMSCTRIDS